MWLLKLALLLAALYVAVVAIVYFAQTRMIFPAGLADRARPELPAEAVRLELETPQGDRLAGTHFPAAGTAPRAPLILGFGGNAWNADALALYLHGLYPDHDVVAFHYRGYRPSGGRPSASAILEDALAVHDHVARRFAPQRIVAVGLSLGSGPAAHLAAHRDLAGVILVTPFDSLRNLAREHYAWAPLFLLRHQMHVAEPLRGSKVPAAIITAEHDRIVPASRSAPVREAIRNLVLDETIAGASHNDIYERQAFAEAMRNAVRLMKDRQ